MIDNFELLANIMAAKPPLEGRQDEFFYFLQILKRHKENPEMSSNNELIRSFYLKSAGHMYEKRDKIITVCKQNNARAYLRLNRRSYKMVALYTLAQISASIATENYNVRRCYESVVGQKHAEGKNKTWIIDIDGDIWPQGLEETIKDLLVKAGKEPKWDVVPTKNGCHLIVQPFNLQDFSTKYPRVDVLKDNPTILYIPYV